MELVELAVVRFRYIDIVRVDYDVGGQFYGRMEGTLEGRLSGELELTNIATARPDGVNTPTFRGVVRTASGALAWAELDGLAGLREEDDARVFVCSARFRTGDAEHRWLNTAVGVLEGVLDTTTMEADARLFECRPTIA